MKWGAKVPQARLITGEADAKRLLLTMTEMTGKKTRTVTLPPIV